ncbi:MAG: hypothetical protein MSS86_06530 [Lachnospiraceae bacterium]|nr:hypothetical protein [Lachnospiraceae bacterium]
MNKEQQFQVKINELRALAKEQNMRVSTSQIEELFSEIGMPKELLGPVYDYLKAKNIAIDDEIIDTDAIMDEEDRNYLDLYLCELGELNEYTEGEKEAFYISAMAGHKESQKRVIEVMLPQVIDIAKLYLNQGVSIEDLIGEGNVALTMGVGMLGALESASEVPEALASMIMNAMEQIIAVEDDTRSADKKVVDKVNKVADAASELAEALGRKVTVDELVAETGFSKKSIEDAVRFSGSKIEDIENGQ